MSHKLCQVKKGFFTLRECQAKAFVECSECGSAVCAQHTSKDVAARIICMECRAKSYKPGTSGNSRSSDVLDELWYFYSRLNYYDTYHYRPFTWHDKKSFDTSMSAERDLIEENDQDVSLLDS